MRKHLSYANVLATFALVFAMSGGALAAKHYLINSTSQINPKVIKKLTGRTGKAGTTGKEGPQGKEGPAGKDGTNGKEGAKGANGATDVVMQFTEVSTPNSTDGSAQANCASGERATGGGVTLFYGNSKDVWYFQPGGRPSLSAHTGEELKDGEAPTAWYASWYNESGSEDKFRVYVICASP